MHPFANPFFLHPALTLVTTDSSPSAVAQHWNHAHASRSSEAASWFQPEARTSLELVTASGSAADSVIDVGAGSSTLVDGLLQRGYRDITLLDVAEQPFVAVRQRLDSAGGPFVHFVVGDVTTWSPARSYSVWHDRAVFHFLTERDQRRAYRQTLARALAPGDRAVIATFALDGPERCSGLPVRRYSGQTLAEEFADLLSPLEHRSETHRTPAGREQAFVFVHFVRK